MRFQYYKRKRTPHGIAEGSALTSEAFVEEASAEENVIEK
jgi:hypothetical protein